MDQEIRFLDGKISYLIVYRDDKVNEERYYVYRQISSRCTRVYVERMLDGIWLEVKRNDT